VQRTLIKICGITSVRDARVAADAGADAIGLVFYPPSPRAVSLEQAREIVASLPPFVTVVALFVDASEDAIHGILRAVPIDWLQFHGEESADFCAAFQRPWMKALRVAPGLDLTAAAGSYAGARALLLDSYRPGVPGGTGERFDWSRVPAQLPRPLVLAGGLDADNVASAIAQVRPAAVDVSGGVEARKGVKDPARIQQFIAAVRAADASQGQQQ
jgi:phosphoribosylanthranilate isomerase|tara:strand:- start:26 stop:670 length:645 start_codon:yes stop_codon:yes gene_type:complete